MQPENEFDMFFCENNVVENITWCDGSFFGMYGAGINSALKERKFSINIDHPKGKKKRRNKNVL